MNVQLNVLYGILTNGDSVERKTTTSTPTNNPDITRLINALIPQSCSPECKRSLAELYIRIIQTSTELQQKLKAIDPINSYKLQSFCKPFTDKAIVTTVIDQIKRLGLLDEENSSLPFDYIRNALKSLLEELNGR